MLGGRLGLPFPPDQLGWRPLGEPASYQTQIPWRVRRTFVSAALNLTSSFQKDDTGASLHLQRG
jgi:hypothetical protein